MSPFITFREPLPSGEMGYFILQRAWPHYVGRIVTDHADIYLVGAQVPHYWMWVSFSGTLQGNLVQAQQNVITEIRTVMTLMANWFEKERISPQPKKYAKWHFAKN
jgi:hypothetical protein